MSKSGNYWLVEPKRPEVIKTKSKKKFKNAEAARMSRELEASWEKLNSKWKPLVAPVRVKRERYVPDTSSTDREIGETPESLNSWVTGAASKLESHTYTGTKIIGIGTMHKSNAIPVFCEDHVVDIAKMRR